MKISVIVILLSVILQKTFSSVVFPKGELSVQIGGGFTTYLVRDPNFGQLVGCQLKDNDLNKVYKIYPRASSNPWYTDNNEVITPHVDDCGAQVRNVSATTSRNWQLVSMDDNLMRVAGHFSIDPIENMGKTTSITLEGTPGQHTSILCPQSNKNKCMIVDSKDQRVLRCSLDVFYPANGKEDIYKCHDLEPETPLTAIVIVKGKYASSVKDIIRNDNNAILSCKSVQKLQWCVGTHAKSYKTIGIESNKDSKGYSTAKTDIDNGLCELVLSSPIQASEKGVWKIVGATNLLYFNEPIQTGCIFYLDYYPNAEIRDLRLRVLTPRTIYTETPYFSVKCEEAPYKLNYCYLLSPDNKIHFAKPAIFRLTSEIGVCHFERVKFKVGRWSCGYNAPHENEPDIVQNLDVHYQPVVYVVASPDNVKVSQNQPVSLLCRIETDEPIQSCMFISPSRIIYNLPSPSFSSSSYSYYGRGFDNGDCGMTLLPPEPKKGGQQELGNYTCSVILKSNHFNYLSTVRLW